VSKMKKVLDTFILSAIILSIIHIFLDECSVIAHWGSIWRNTLLIVGFSFDLIFSIEFSLKSVFSRKRNDILYYLKYERGWADLLSSFPLLLLDSGPSLFFLLTAGTGAPGVFEVIKILRINRILRLFRIVKLFGKIHNTESKMARFHISAINTTVVSAVIIVFLFFTLSFNNISGYSLKERSSEYINLIDGLKRISDMNGIGYRELSETMLLSDKNILKIVYPNGTVVEKLPDSEFIKKYNKEDYITVTGRACTVFVSVTDINRENAFQQIQILMMIIFIVISVMIFYSEKFVRNISDVIHILNRGFRKKEYNLQVKIPEKYKDHEIYNLALFYNNAYLPAKMKKNMAREMVKKTSP
jgi:hypothetical protein